MPPSMLLIAVEETRPPRCSAALTDPAGRTSRSYAARESASRVPCTVTCSVLAEAPTRAKQATVAISTTSSTTDRPGRNRS